MGGASAVHHGRELTLSFEQEMDADADAQEDQALSPVGEEAGDPPAPPRGGGRAPPAVRW